MELIINNKPETAVQFTASVHKFREVDSALSVCKSLLVICLLFYKAICHCKSCYSYKCFGQ